MAGLGVFIFSVGAEKKEICLHLAKPQLLHRLKTLMVEGGAERRGSLGSTDAERSLHGV